MTRHSFIHVFRGRLVAAAGIGAIAPYLCVAACGGTAVVDGQGDGSGGSNSNGSSSSSSRASSSVNGTSVTAISVGVGGAGGATTGLVTCFVKNDPATPCPALQQAENMYGSCTSEGLEILQWVDGPFEQQGMCCYEVVVGADCPVVGRPFVVAGAPLTAALRVGDDAWGRAGEQDETLDPDDRRRLAEGWARDGLFEHASIASFARFALELMAVAAPPQLLAAAHRAALDETRHAEMCFALASRYAGGPLGPDRFPIDADAAPRRTLVEVAVATAAEGCIGETIAAALAQHQLEHARDPEVRHALSVIAEDEARHAELAWRTLAWALAHGGDEVHRALSRVFADAQRHLPHVGELEDDRLAAHGRLSARRLGAVAREVLDEVVLPCAKALLDQHATRREALEAR